MIVLSEKILDFAVGYPLGALFLFLGLMVVSPKFAAKLLKKEKKDQTIAFKLSGVLFLVLGIAIIVARYMGKW